jgi:PAS domain S-box-containing protein
MAKPRIMVVEDDRIIADHIEITLNNLGYGVTAMVGSGEEAVKRAERDNPDLVLMDLVLKGKMDGIEAASQIRSLLNIPVVFLTAFSGQKMLERAKVTEPFGYIIKPFEDRELHSIIEIALYKSKIEKKLKENREWLHTTLNSIRDAVITLDNQGSVTFMNPVARSLTGWNHEETLGEPLKKVLNIMDGRTGKEVTDPGKDILNRKTINGPTDNLLLISKNGRKTPIAASGSPIQDKQAAIHGLVLVIKDISERKKAEEKLRETLREKEILLKEIHHRVKNNMQIVHSLLNIQSRQLKDIHVLNILKETQNRIRSIGLIHEQLYKSENFSKIEFGEYIQKLVEGLFQSYRIDPDHVSPKIDAAGVTLDINKAIPCGLIINELVSNSLKHAFKEGRKGVIQVQMMSGTNGQFALAVNDNGVGFPESLDFESAGTLGLQLVNILVDQIRGAVKLDRENGTLFHITFGT